MSRPIRRIAPLIVAGLISAGLGAPASSQAATTCKLSLTTARHMGPTYVTLLKQSGTNCKNAIKVTRAFQACRLKKGVTGRCTTKVRGYSCTDKRPASETIPTQFTGHVTCRRGSVRIIHEYQQDT